MGLFIQPGILLGLAICVLSFVPVAAAADAKASEEELAKPFVYRDHGKRDPFWRLVNAQGLIVNFDKEKDVNTKVAVKLALEGIVFEKPGAGVAMINGEILKTGDQIESYVVEDISANTVVLKKGTEQLTLELKTENPEE